MSFNPKQTPEQSNTNHTNNTEPLHPNTQPSEHDTGWGNLPTIIDTTKTLQVIGHNINGLELYKPPNDQKTQLLLENTYNQQAHVLLLQENNIDFKTIEARLDWNMATKNYWTGHHSSHSTSTAAPRTGRYLPGGTTTSVLGEQSSRVIQSGTDNTGMGRYSWVTLQGKENRTITMISAYRVCSTKTPGPFTAYSQQAHIMSIQGNTNPDPRQETIQDLTDFIQKKTRIRTSNSFIN